MMNDKENIKFKKILVINFGGIGDFLLSTPSLKALRALNQDAEISLLGTARIKDIAEDLLYIDKYYNFALELGGNIPFSGLLKDLLVCLLLRTKGFDLAINMRTLHSESSAKKIKMILNIINAKQTAGRNTEGWGSFFDIKIPETEKGQKYEMEYDVDTVTALGAEVTDRSVDFPIDENSELTVMKILEANGVTHKNFLIGIHPGGKPWCRWPIEHFKEVINKIGKDHGCIFVVTGAKSENDLADFLKSNTEANVINLAGKLNIKQSGAVIKQCNLFLTNDTGPMHIASILNVPLIAIFGSSYLTRYDPRNLNKDSIVIHKSGSSDEGEPAEAGSIKNIMPNEIIKYVETFINTKGFG